MYSAEIIVNGVKSQIGGREIIVNGIKGYVGGSNAQDFADGVKACAEAIENALGVHSDEYYDPYDEDYDDDEGYGEDWYEDALYCLMSILSI